VGCPQKTRIVECPSREHNTAQSNWPARANSPRMTFVSVGPPTPRSATWGIVQSRASSARVIDGGSCFREECLNVGAFRMTRLAHPIAVVTPSVNAIVRRSARAGWLGAKEHLREVFKTRIPF
jgi:hypothetical protein